MARKASLGPVYVGLAAWMGIAAAGCNENSDFEPSAVPQFNPPGAAAGSDGTGLAGASSVAGAGGGESNVPSSPAGAGSGGAGSGGAGEQPIAVDPPLAGASGAATSPTPPPAPPPDVEVTFDAEGCPIPPPMRLTRVATLAQTGMLLDQVEGDDRIFIAERPGRVLILRGGELLPTPFIDFRDSVAPLETERGLLSLALHPGFLQNGRFFALYTRAVDDAMTPELDSLGDLVLAEGATSPESPDVAVPTLTPLLTIPKDVRYHNGGMIAFGPDGYLYVSTGEDGRIYDFRASTLQETDHKLGKILRIDVDAPDTSPPGNLPGADIHVWDYGLRNPWRMSFDRLTGDLYIGDVGEATWDEIIFEPAGQGGRNYGWGVFEANQCLNQFGSCFAEEHVPPVLAIPHDGPGSVDNRCTNDFEADASECNRAVVGGYVYRGVQLPELAGRYLYGDYIQNTVRSFIVDGGEATCPQDHTEDLVSPETRLQGIVSFSEDASGELYVLDLFGNVYRIDRE